MREKSDLLIINGHIVTMDPKRRVFQGAVAITGNQIVAVDKTHRVEERYSGEERIDARHMAILPGLIDNHTHNLQILLRRWRRTLAHRPHTPATWLEVLMPFESILTKEEAHLSSVLSCLNTIKDGTTCHVESGAGGQNNADQVGKAMEATGVRGVVSRRTLDMGASEQIISSTEDAVKENLRLVVEWNGKANGRIKAWFSGGGIFFCSEELREQFKELALKNRVGIQLHLAENSSEVESSLDRWGERPVEHLYRTGFLGPEVLAIHMMYLTEREMQMIRKRDVKIVHCPSGNLNRTRVLQMLAQGITVSLGSDSGITRSRDLFNEMRVASVIHQIREIPHYDNVALTNEDLLSMATIYGAKAIHWDEEIGSIEVGKKADLILIDLKKSHIQPVGDVPKAIVHRVKGSDVDTTIIDGRVVMRNRQILTVDEDRILDEVQEKTPKILSRLGIS